MTHEEFEELVPAYVLNALAPGEEMHLRAHLETCRTCAIMQQEHLETTGYLALMAPPVSPPADLKERILVEASRAPRAAPPPVRPRRRSGWARMGAAIAAAAAIVLAVVAGALGLVGYSQARELRQVLAVVGSASRTVDMSPASQDGAAGRIYIAGGDRVALVMSGLPDPGDRVYQLWLIEEGRPVPLDAFRPEAGVAAFTLRARLGPGQDMAVTLEPSAGNTAPRGPQVLST